MIELTPEQRQELQGPELPRAIDPQTGSIFVLVREDVYQRLQAALEGNGLDMRQVAILVEQAMQEEDAGDPALASYQKYRSPS